MQPKLFSANEIASPCSLKQVIGALIRKLSLASLLSSTTCRCAADEEESMDAQEFKRGQGRHEKQGKNYLAWST